MPAPSKIHSKGAKPGDTTLVVRNIDITDGKGGTVRTSMRLEPYVWDALNEIARRERRTPSQICDIIAHTKPPEAMLTGAVRLFILNYFLHAATEVGHRDAGHCGSDDAVFSRFADLMRTQVDIVRKSRRGALRMIEERGAYRGALQPSAVPPPLRSPLR